MVILVVHGWSRMGVKGIELTRTGSGLIVVAAMVMTLASCGDDPLDSLGLRSSGWINEPEIVTTTLPPANAPRLIDGAELLWANDDIETQNLDDSNALIQEVFARREGDRFIQASRYEIAVALPDVGFPAAAPYGAEWVSSQLVIENSGVLSAEPSAAFGIWSAEPYTRSRSVAQMIVIRVAIDPETAAEIEAPGAEISCARFADRTTEDCSIVDIAGKPIWRLASTSGTTLVWFAGQYRYEMFGRHFIAPDILQDMAADQVRLADLNQADS